jgi:hypothetical protein
MADVLKAINSSLESGSSCNKARGTMPVGPTYAIAENVPAWRQGRIRASRSRRAGAVLLFVPDDEKRFIDVAAFMPAVVISLRDRECATW